MKETDKPEWVQKDVKFQSGDVPCVASIYSPAGLAAEKLPCVILGHGFGGVRQMLARYGEAFAAQGWKALCFDYRGFGDSGGAVRQVLRISDQLSDWRAAIAYAKTLAGVDPQRIGLWGSSLGGGHVISVAATDQTVKAVVAQVPHINGFDALKALGIRQVLKIAPLFLQDLLACLFRRGRKTLPLLGKPGDLAVMTADATDRFLKDMKSTVPQVRDDIAAASTISVATYFPGRVIHHVRCPLLMIIADRDGTALPSAALAAAAMAPNCTVVRFDAQHFDVYLDPFFGPSVKAQIEFFKRYL